MQTSLESFIQRFTKSIDTNEKLSENLLELSEAVKDKIVFSTSFGIEDQAITHAILTQNIQNIEIFTLDTGRLFEETYSVWQQTIEQYTAQIKSYYPHNQTLENFIDTHGINAFYQSAQLRKDCCAIRKVEPLKRALQGAKIWITGLRAEHSPNRNSLKVIEWDQNYQLFKYNPLLHWTSEEVKEYVKTNNIPYNTLHDKGFVSIGCSPCTRAIQEGEDFRAGRWWWEEDNKKECGLHK